MDFVVDNFKEITVSLGLIYLFLLYIICQSFWNEEVISKGE